MLVGDEQEALQKSIILGHRNTNILYAGFSEYQSGLAIDLLEVVIRYFLKVKSING